LRRIERVRAGALTETRPRPAAVRERRRACTRISRRAERIPDRPCPRRGPSSSRTALSAGPGAWLRAASRGRHAPGGRCAAMDGDPGQAARRRFLVTEESAVVAASGPAQRRCAALADTGSSTKQRGRRRGRLLCRIQNRLERRRGLLRQRRRRPRGARAPRAAGTPKHARMLRPRRGGRLRPMGERNFRETAGITGMDQPETPAFARHAQKAFRFNEAPRARYGHVTYDRREWCSTCGGLIEVARVGSCRCRRP